MSKKGIRLIRGSFSDALDDHGRVQKAQRHDPPAGDEGAWTYKAGQWAGAPADRLPPACPVIPLGREGFETYVFMDSMGALNKVKRSEWSKKTLLDLFAATPNYLYHHWPRFNAKTFAINGLEVDDAIQCLMHACALAGTISIADTVRGRGAWTTGPMAALPGRGELVWHAGDGIYRVRKGMLEPSGPTAIDGTVYPGRAPILSPWQEPVPVEESPAAELFDLIKSFSFGRKVLDPVLVIGWIGAAMLGGALPWRPYIFLVGDRGVGKTSLQNVVKAVLGDSLLRTADATAAGIRQMLGSDCLPVAVDELENSEDNRRVTGILDLARIAASADVAIRGGADHEATQFTIRSAMIFSAINPPTMTVADRSRMAMITLEKRPRSEDAKEPVLNDETVGRRLLRALMDAWPAGGGQPGFAALRDGWRKTLRAAGMSDRAQDTYGTLMALAEMLLGPEALEEHGVPIGEERLGTWLKNETVSERAAQRDNFMLCLERMFGFVIGAWREGVQPTIGDVIDQFRHGQLKKEEAQARLKLVGLSVRETEIDGRPRQFLAVPVSAELGPAKVFEKTAFQGGGWNIALKQAPPNVVIHGRGNWQLMKINGMARQCLMVDLQALESIGQEEE